MRRILVISLYMAQDPVGLTPMIAPLQHAGIEVVALPTMLLSNHPERAHGAAGVQLEPAVLEKMTAAIAANAGLDSFDAILTGYLASVRHATWIAKLVMRMRELNPSLLYICDPTLGDDPNGFFIDPGTAAVMRDTLVDLADILTPNRFELAWLANTDVQSVDDAREAALKLACPVVAATSIPSGTDRLANVLVNAGNVDVREVEKLDDVPYGTGDLFAGFLAARLLRGAPVTDAWAHAVQGVASGIEASRDSDRLMLPLIDWAWLSS